LGQFKAKINRRPGRKALLTPDHDAILVAVAQELPRSSLDVSGFCHLRINRSILFARGKNHIYGIENFWNQAKRVLGKCNGVSKESSPLFLKECEIRFNDGTPKQQLRIFKEWAGIWSLSTTAPCLIRKWFCNITSEPYLV
jgi:transposase